jgi:hypothetical protein
MLLQEQTINKNSLKILLFNSSSFFFFFSFFFLSFLIIMSNFLQRIGLASTIILIYGPD